MNAQRQYEACLTILSVIVKHNASGQCAEYWNNSIAAAMEKQVKPINTTGGAIQDTLSNPLAYFMVPMFEHACAHAGLRKPVVRGRTLEHATAQFIRVCRDGLTNRADKAMRISNDMSIEEMAKAKQYAMDGLATAYLKRTSHNKEIRSTLNQQSIVARQLRQVPDIKEDIREIGFE